MQVLPQRAVPGGQGGVPAVGVGVGPITVGVAVGGLGGGGGSGVFSTGGTGLWVSALTISAPSPTAATEVRPTRTVRRDKPRAALPT
jgi:hypothetical protein